MTDRDADGLPDDADNCAIDPNPSQEDYDGDGVATCATPTTTTMACSTAQTRAGCRPACRPSSSSAHAIPACRTRCSPRACSITESIVRIADANWNHGRFVSQTTHFGDRPAKGRADFEHRPERPDALRGWSNIK